jgi:uncharacterized 2Fe-2S/4Fe-4S cluster protein (DUF4445 family)
MSLKIRIPALNKEIPAERGEILSDILRRAGIPLSAYCGGKGLCGKCAVHILEGDIPRMDSREESYFTRREHKPGLRLACLLKLKNHLTIEIPQSSLLRAAKILKTGFRAPVLPDASVKKYALTLKPATIGKPVALADLLSQELESPGLEASPLLLKRLTECTTAHGATNACTAILFEGRTLLGIEPGDTVEDNYGLAVDVGTTTVAAELVHLMSGHSLAADAAFNGQLKFGADVISRLGVALEGPERREELRLAAVATVSDLCRSLCQKGGISPAQIYDVVLSANTAMNHLFLGFPVNTLAAAPYSPVFTHLPPLSAADAGLPVNPSALLYITPNIRSFVGGDISAGLAAVSFLRRPGVQLYIDLGTNGEIVLKTDKGLSATSTAAGPAFEGANIGFGMLALPGAIHKAKFDCIVRVETIQGLPAAGICGTGLIDLMAVFLNKGLILPSGTVTTPDRKIPVTEAIHLDQKDVREVQLAVAAVRTGIALILERNGLTLDQVDGLIIAGAFGNSLDLTSAKRIGLLPALDSRKMVFVGNAALGGAKALLISKAVRKEVMELVDEIEFVSLASSPQFQDRFIEALTFPDPTPS